MRQNTRDRILQSAITLFSRKGFNATTTLEIAQQAGVAEVTVFRHFKTKKDILLAVLEHFLERFGKTVILGPVSEILERHGGGDRRELFRLLVKDRVTLLQKNSDILWIILTEAKYHAELKEKIWSSFGQDALRLIEKLFPRLTGQEPLRPDRTEAVFRAFCGTVLALALQYSLGFLPAEKPLDEAIDEAVDILLHGIGHN